MSCQAPVFCSPPQWAIQFPNLVGPTGPQGPVGATGVQGPSGPLAASGIKAEIYGAIDAGSEVILDLYAWEAYKVTNVAAKLTSGTATVTFKIDGISISGLTNIPITNALSIHTGLDPSNIVFPGSKFSVVVGAAAGASTLSLSINTPMNGLMLP